MQRLLRVGTPLSVDRLRKHLEAIDEPHATVRQYGSDLLVEAPDPTLLDHEDEGGPKA